MSPFHPRTWPRYLHTLSGPRVEYLTSRGLQVGRPRLKVALLTSPRPVLWPGQALLPYLCYAAAREVEVSLPLWLAGLPFLLLCCCTAAPQLDVI